MAWFNPLSGFQRSPSGLEWRLWRRLPAVLAWGTAGPAALAAVLWLAAPAATRTEAERASQTLLYTLAGVVALHWALVLTLAIGCVIVMVMKGPAYVADPYPPAGRGEPD